MIGLSVKGKYGLAAMLEIASNVSQNPINIATISEKCGISQNYLEQILGDLKRDGYLISLRGSRGGYKLAKSADKIYVSEILNCLEGRCQLSGGSCEGSFLHKFWRQKEDQINELFAVPLQDLVHEHNKKNQTLTYTI